MAQVLPCRQNRLVPMSRSRLKEGKLKLAYPEDKTPNISPIGSLKETAGLKEQSYTMRTGSAVSTSATASQEPGGRGNISWSTYGLCFLLSVTGREQTQTNANKRKMKNYTSFYAPPFRDGETTIKVKFSLLRGGGSLGAEGRIVPKRCFSWETPRQ